MSYEVGWGTFSNPFNLEKVSQKLITPDPLYLPYSLSHPNLKLATPVTCFSSKIQRWRVTSCSGKYKILSFSFFFSCYSQIWSSFIPFFFLFLQPLFTKWSNSKPPISYFPSTFSLLSLYSVVIA